MKYVIKNCPAYRDINQVYNEIKGFCPNAESKYVHECLCKDITDCLLKRIVNECKWETNIDIECRGDLAERILSELEIEEVDE